MDTKYKSPHRNKIEMENIKFNYDDHIVSYLQREKKKGIKPYEIAKNKVDSSYTDRLIGKAYGRRNPELIEDLDLQHYDNPFERQYRINELKNSPRVSVSVKRKPKTANEKLAESEGFREIEKKYGNNSKTSIGEDLFNKMRKVLNSKGVERFVLSASSSLGVKFANYSWKKMAAVGAAAGAVGATTLSIGMYSNRIVSNDSPPSGGS